MTGQNDPNEDQPEQADQGALVSPERLAGEERLSEQVARTGMFGTGTTGDTSGYGGLLVRRPPAISTPRPYGSYFDDLADTLSGALQRDALDFGDAVERVVVDRGDEARALAALVADLDRRTYAGGDESLDSARVIELADRLAKGGL